MRQLKGNKQKLYYSQPQSKNIIDSKGHKLVNDKTEQIVYENINPQPITDDIYAKDEDGNVIYTTVDGVSYPVLSETKSYYDPPTIFYANISFDGGETKPAEYGLDTSGYNAVISVDKGKYHFSEKTLIWHESEPEVDQYGRVLPETADYRIVAIKTSLNEERLFLKKRVDDE